MGTLTDLAERLEAYDPALSPDNRTDEIELHRDIVMATGVGSMNPTFEATFLRSLDAAMTLVPEALAWWVQDYRGDGCNAIVGKLGSDARGNFLEFCHCSRECKTPALALCAAALRARSQESNHG